MPRRNGMRKVMKPALPQEEAVEIAVAFLKDVDRAGLPEPTYRFAKLHDPDSEQTCLYHRATWEVWFDAHHPPGVLPREVLVCVEVKTKRPSYGFHF